MLMRCSSDADKSSRTDDETKAKLSARFAFLNYSSFQLSVLSITRVPDMPKAAPK